MRSGVTNDKRPKLPIREQREKMSRSMANFQIADKLSFISRSQKYEQIARFATGRHSRPASLSTGAT
jgi:hypothetical protein